MEQLKYPYYRDEPTLSLVKVTTASGETEYKSNCRRLGDGLFYVKGIDLQYDERIGDWVLSKTSAPVLDYETGKMVTMLTNMIQGIVSIDNNGVPTLGYFTRNPLNNVLVYTKRGQYWCLNVSLVDALPAMFSECYSDGTYYQLGQDFTPSAAALRKKVLGKNHGHSVYNIEDDKRAFKSAIDIYDSWNPPISKELKAIARYIPDLTFGAELECISGTLPAHILARNGLIICKDGSTKDGNGSYPPEFVTVPLKGAKGLQTLINLSQEIEKRCGIDIKCSYHLHTGGTEITRVFMVSLYRLCFKIQNDVFKMFPFYKTNPEGIKEKNYCKKLMNIIKPFGDKNFNEYINQSFFDLYSMLSGGVQMDANYNVKAKLNPWGDHKWEMKTRYFWVNFTNPIFGKHDTIEFRIHTPTLNADKIINWLFMCNAIIKFADVYTERCIKLNKISFEEVLDYYSLQYKTPQADQLTANLKAYYNDRVEYFAKDLRSGNVTSPEEMANDAKFNFKIY